MVKNKHIFIPFGLLLLAFLVFAFHLGVIPHLYFDELHYIPAATQWLHGMPTRNIEHPLMGKLIMAVFVKLFGDNFFGWRLGSVLFGSLSILFVYKIALYYFKEQFTAVVIGLLAIFNFWFFVQSRIAMIEIYMVAFFLMAWFYQLRFFEEQVSKYLYLSAIFWGLSIATKWSIVVFFFPALALFWFRGYRKQIAYFILVIMGVYYLTFIPYILVKNESHLEWYQIFWEMPLRMLELQKSVGGVHVYESKWYTWPLMIRPIWYEYKSLSPENVFQGVFLLGNPLQMAVGLLSVFGALFFWKKIKRPEFKELLFMVLISYFTWAVIPRKMTYFYYFFPSAVLYLFLIPMFFEVSFKKNIFHRALLVFLGASIGLFIFFYPVLSGILTPVSIRNHWLWFSSWI